MHDFADISCAKYVFNLVQEIAATQVPDDVEALKALLIAARLNLVERDQRIANQQERISNLEHRVHVLTKWVFGPRTERSVVPAANAANQAWLPFADLLESAQRVADRHGVHGSIELGAPRPVPQLDAGKRRSDFPEHLPRVRTTIEVPEAARMCCKQPMEPMGFETSKELERIEFALVHEIARTKYCCRICQMRVITAPGPTRPFPRALLGNQWLAQLAVERFGNHMPYHRLEQKYKSEGLSLSRTVLSRSMIEMAELCEPIHAALGNEVARGDVAFADETRARVKESKHGPPKWAWMWLYANKHGDCFFDYSESRGRDSPARVLADFDGYLHDDGYAVYEAALDPARIKHVACWAHVRRKFDEAKDKEPELATEALAWIARLFAIDSAARARKLGIEELCELRREHAPPILAGFKEWLQVRLTQVLPKSGVANAIGYALGRWEALCRFLEDGRLELDNNRSERALRPVAVGRKNWVFFGNERGGKTAAVFYSLVKTCKERGINPRVYLADVMLRLAEGEDPTTLTPGEWAKRFGAEVEERRGFVLPQLTAKLAK